MDNSKDSVSKGASKDASKDSTTSGHGAAHHIEEFGEVDNIVHQEKDVGSAVASISVLGARYARRLRKRVLRKRHLQQHFEGETLYRTIATRTVSQDELFLDLIIVANST